MPGRHLPPSLHGEYHGGGGGCLSLKDGGSANRYLSLWGIMRPLSGGFYF